MATPALLQNNNSGTSGTTSAKPYRQRLWLHILLFFLTFFSTTMVGMRYMYNFSLGHPALASDADLFPYTWVAHNLRIFSSGLPFSMTLLGILLTHEFGHYFACRYYKVRTTLPFLLPAPTLSGTCGAVIRLRSRIRSRSALIMIGASGPIAGFCVALVTTTLGLLLSKPVDGTSQTSIIQFKAPLIVMLLRSMLLRLHYVIPAVMVPHPVLIASWIGLLITSLNLIPAGQLDGGHIFYALSPRGHRWCTRSTILALFVLGAFYWMGWFLWALLLLLPGMRHPKVPADEPVAHWQWSLVPICLLILALTATVRPFTGVSMHEVLHRLH